MFVGTTKQTWINKTRNRKKALLRKKYNTYRRHVSKYNSQHQRRDAIYLPTFDEVEALQVTDAFWDVGALSHPEEDWASNKHTKEGIRQYLLKRAADEELKRISRETRQLVQWALEHQQKLDKIQEEITQAEGK